MEARRQKNVGLVSIAAGTAVIAVALFLFGITTPASGTSSATSDLDGVNVVTAVCGLVLVLAGAYEVFRSKGAA